MACKVTEAGSETLTLNANGSFGFTPIFNVFDTISVEVVAPPTGPVSQTCETTQTGLNGSMFRGSLQPITVTCTAAEYTVGGQVSGLAGTGLVLQNNAGDNLSITDNGAFTFPTALADGSRYDMNAMTAAHKSLPFGTVVRVTNKRTGQSCLVRITDRGPYIDGRIIDLSKAAAKSIGMLGSGVAPVKVEVLAPRETQVASGLHEDNLES